jgi:hypothetical protein
MLPAHDNTSRPRRHALRIVRPPEACGHVRYWRINGYVASIHCWSDEEFRRLTEPPQDAVHYPEGVWIKLDWR